MSDVVLQPELQKKNFIGRIASSGFVRVTKYALVRLLTIAVTIFIGIFITVVIANRGGFVDMVVANDVEQALRAASYDGSLFAIYGDTPHVEQIARQELEEKYGLYLPFFQRHLRWTINTLTFNWGQVLNQLNLNLRTTNFSYLGWFKMPSGLLRYRVLSIILDHFPNTLLLVVTANALVFFLGIPLALHLSTKYGEKLDKLLVALSPISSIPAWVHGIFLVIIFSIQLHWFPLTGMLDPTPPSFQFGYIFVVLKHMILPVTAIFLSMFFQCIYSWRTYFLLHSSEDYVDLARAKGLPDSIIQKQYILRPTLPYIVTSSALLLLGFWQMTTALEFFFRWPGIGLLYVESLGVNVKEIRTIDAVLVIGIVVIFAYLTGLSVLVLDVIYAALDPRVHVAPPGKALKPVKRWLEDIRSNRRGRAAAVPLPARHMISEPWNPTHFLKHRVSLKTRFQAAKKFLRELARYPSAMIGLFMVIVLLGVATYTVITIPPGRAMDLWSPKLTSRFYLPKLARPAWFNWFTSYKEPTTMIFDSRTDAAIKTVDGMNTTLRFTFDYPFEGFPEEIGIYYHVKNADKAPFTSTTWIMPDGRELPLEQTAIIDGQNYYLSTFEKTHYAIQDMILYGQSSMRGQSAINRFFITPTSNPDTAIQGTYTLLIQAQTFEPDAEFDAELVLTGQIFGIAGTDNLRRDLAVPLLWGLPIALAFGLFGAVITTVLSMFVAAAGAWFGGWVDAIFQRLTEANMILPILAIGVMVYYYYGVSLWWIMGAVVLLNVFGSPTKTYRAAFMQIKESPYVEAARAYGASNTRIIVNYLIPRILPVMVPQLVALIPSYVFLEATLGIFGVGDVHLPTWGRLLYEAIKGGAFSGNYYWIAEPIFLLLLTGLVFSMFGFALDRVLNPRLRDI